MTAFIFLNVAYSFLSSLTYFLCSSTEEDVDSSLGLVMDNLKLQPPKNIKRRQRTTSSCNTASPVVRSGIRQIYTQGRPPWYDSQGQLEEAFVIGNN